MIMGERSDVSRGLIDPLSYKLVVFDLDGTLYHQAPVRRAMLMDLLRDGGDPGRFARFKTEKFVKTWRTKRRWTLKSLCFPGWPRKQAGQNPSWPTWSRSGWRRGRLFI